MTEQLNLFSEPEASPEVEVAPRDVQDIPTPPVNSYDPNERRVRQLRGAGGGFADAVAGELTRTVAQDDTQDRYRPVFELPGKDGRRHPGSQPLTRRQAQRGLSPEKIDRQQAINRAGAELARQALRDARNHG